MIYSFEYLLRTTSAIMLVTNRFCEGTITPQIKSPAFKLILDGVFLIGGVYNIFLWVCRCNHTVLLISQMQNRTPLFVDIYSHWHFF